MEVRVRVNVQEAIRRGYAADREMVLRLRHEDVAQLTPEDRALLAAALRGRDGELLDRRSYVLVIPEPTVAGIIEALRADAAAAAEEARRRAEQEAALQKAAEELVQRLLSEEVEHVAIGGVDIPVPRERLTSHVLAYYGGRSEPPSRGEVARAAVRLAGEADCDVERRAAKLLAESHGDLLDSLVADVQADIEARREAERRAEQARREAAEAERLAWIEAHGSPRLRRLVAEGIECDAVYRDERLAAERPGWRWSAHVVGRDLEPRNAPESALALLDEARATLPAELRAEARLRYWVVEHTHCPDCGPPHIHCPDDEDCPEYDWRGYAVVSEFLGREIVYGGPEEG